jgi:hypothetical protein
MAVNPTAPGGYGKDTVMAGIETSRWRCAPRGATAASAERGPQACAR